jgi:hypothetical protein
VLGELDEADPLYWKLREVTSVRDGGFEMLPTSDPVGASIIADEYLALLAGLLVHRLFYERR